MDPRYLVSDNSLNLLVPQIVIHGYVQLASVVAGNTCALREKLSDIATLHYVDGPPMRNASRSSSRPWWILDSNLEHDMTASDRWDDTVCSYHLTPAIWSLAMILIGCKQVNWWSNELSKNQYDGIIGLSQGAAMGALLISMVNTNFLSIKLFLGYVADGNYIQLNHPERVPGFHPKKTQPIKFAILCSGASSFARYARSRKLSRLCTDSNYRFYIQLPAA